MVVGVFLWCRCWRSDSCKKYCTCCSVQRPFQSRSGCQFSRSGGLVMRCVNVCAIFARVGLVLSVISFEVLVRLVIIDCRSEVRIG